MQKYSHRLRVRFVQNGFPLFFLPAAVFLRLSRSERPPTGPSFSVSFRLRPKHFPHYLDLFNGSQRVEIILILFGFFFYLSYFTLTLSLSLAPTPSTHLSLSLHHFTPFIIIQLHSLWAVSTLSSITSLSR